MSRRRYITTDISHDERVNILAEEYGDFAALLYTWMIPHAEDDATIRATPYQLLLKVVPGRRSKTVEDVIAALEGMQKLGLIEWDRERNLIGFPTESFYRYQTYVRPEKRRTVPLAKYGLSAKRGAKQRRSAKNAEVQRSAPEVAENAVSPSPSPTPTPTPSAYENIRPNGGRSAAADPAPSTEAFGKSDPVREFWQYFCDVWRDVYPRGPELTEGRRRKIKARLRRFSLDDLKRACDNLHASAWARGENERGWVADIDYLIRNDEVVDRWLRRPEAHPPARAAPTPQRKLRIFRPPDPDGAQEVDAA